MKEKVNDISNLYSQKYLTKEQRWRTYQPNSKNYYKTLISNSVEIDRDTGNWKESKLK